MIWCRLSGPSACSCFCSISCSCPCSSFSSVQRDTLQFAYPVPSRRLLRARRLQPQWFSGARLLRTLPAFGWRLFQQHCFDGETKPVPLSVLILKDDIFFLLWSYFFFRTRLVFFNTMWDARSLRSARGVLPSPAVAAWLNRVSRLVFPSAAPRGTRGVCMQTVVYLDKVGLFRFLDDGVFSCCQYFERSGEDARTNNGLSYTGVQEYEGITILLETLKCSKCNR